MSVLDVVALLLFLAPVPGWVATVILLAAASRRPRIAALTERAVAALVLSVAATLLALLGSARLANRPVDPDIAVAILATVCLTVSVPSVVWLARFLRGDFGGAE